MSRVLLPLVVRSLGHFPLDISWPAPLGLWWVWSFWYLTLLLLFRLLFGHLWLLWRSHGLGLFGFLTSISAGIPYIWWSLSTKKCGQGACAIFPYFLSYGSSFRVGSEAHWYSSLSEVLLSVWACYAFCFYCFNNVNVNYSAPILISLGLCVL